MLSTAKLLLIVINVNRQVLQLLSCHLAVLPDVQFKTDVKNVFTFFYFPNVFLFLKNAGKVQSGKQINKKHFQNNSNETDL